MPLSKNLPCPKCQNPMLSYFDKERQANVCDCPFCGFNCLLKHYRAISKPELSGLLEEEMTEADLDELESVAWQDKNKLVSWFLEFEEHTKEELQAKTLEELQKMANKTGLTSDFFINYR